MNETDRKSTRFKPLGPSILVMIAAGAILAAVLSGCKSQVDPYELDLTRKGFFQGAIEAFDAGNYKLAIRYYEAFKAKHPGDLYGNLWASYEIAFCTYKMRKYERAEELFVALLERYEELGEREDPGQSEIPAGPRILAEKILTEIREKTNPSQ